MSEVKKTFNKKTWVISTLRRASYRWKPRSEALTRARTSRGSYTCEQCKTEGLKKDDIAIDHITPVVPIEGWDTFDGFIERLFCDSEGLQVICRSPCHDTKTMIEDEMRKANKAQQREELKLSEKEAKLEAKRIKALEKKENKKHV